MFLDRTKYLLNPSGLNDTFCCDGLDFASYIQITHDMIAKARADLNVANASLIIDANSPFSLPSKHSSQTENGVLLIHGLFDSPYYMRDLGQYFNKRDFLVNAILLPGHGTVPGDLLHIHAIEWLKAVNFGLQQLATQAKNIYIAGFSLGSVLALLQAVKNTQINIKGLLLFSPGLQPKSKIKPFIANYHKAFSWLNDRVKWYQLRKPTNAVKYNSYPCNAGYQAYQLISQLNVYLAVNEIALPLFVVVSADDETISSPAVINFFQNQLHPSSKLILYSNNHHSFADARITIRPTQFSDERILNFSHTCIPISPDNPILGRHSNFLDINHYPKGDVQLMKRNMYFGAAIKPNYQKGYVSRLSYNPDFSYMTDRMGEFLDDLSDKI